MLTHFSLCTGIGGLDLAAEMAGFETIAQCEIDDYAGQVLAKNFKGVHNFGDIRTITNATVRAAGIDPASITVLSAGFPCQPYSLAGKGRGDGDERDLWGEVARVIGELKPRWFVGENTPGLFARANQRYFHRVVKDLSALGYTVGWGMWGACDAGAPHKRDRVFIVACASSNRETQNKSERTHLQHIGLCENVSNTDGLRQLQPQRGEQNERERTGNICQIVPFPSSKWEIKRRQWELSSLTEIKRARTNIGRGTTEHGGGQWWETEPEVGRVADGIPARVDRLRCLGNAVVPMQAYPIFKAIAEIENKGVSHA